MAARTCSAALPRLWPRSCSVARRSSSCAVRPSRCRADVSATKQTSGLLLSMPRQRHAASSPTRRTALARVGVTRATPRNRKRRRDLSGGTVALARAIASLSVSLTLLSSPPLLHVLAEPRWRCSRAQPGEVPPVPEEAPQHQPVARPVPLPLAGAHLLADYPRHASAEDGPRTGRARAPPDVRGHPGAV